MGVSDAKLLKPTNPVGIVGYGSYVPRYRLPAKEVARIWTDGQGGLPIQEKAVAGIDGPVLEIDVSRIDFVSNVRHLIAVYEGIETLLAFIFAHNSPSLVLYSRYAFARWGTLPHVAVLDGVRRDLLILGRSVG